MTHRGPFQPLPFCDSVILLMAAVETPPVTVLQSFSHPGGTGQAASHMPPGFWSQPNLILPCCHAQWLTEALKECVLVPLRQNPNSVASGV